MMELRDFAFEVRAAEPSEDGPLVLEGYAAVFDSRSQPLGAFGFVECIRAGAFSKSLASRSEDIFALWNHNTDLPLASRDSGTLSLEEDKIGLKIRMELDREDPWSQRAYRSTQKGIVKKMSFGFSAENDEWRDEDGQEVRNLLEVRLFEVSPVVFPAYTATQLHARSISHDATYARRHGQSIDQLIAARNQKPAQLDPAALVAAQQRSLRLRLAQAR